MKSYYGNASTEERESSVMVRTDRLKKLTHHLRHSPGFDWGYAGAPPKELARCILMDAFGIVECPDAPQNCQCENDWVESTYRAFKDEVVSRLEKNKDWKLEQKDIVDWVFDYLAADHQEQEEEEEEEPLLPASV
jgi:hypothetical protein